MEKLLPFCRDAEEAVLASILIDPSCWAMVRGQISASDFFREQHKWIFEAMEHITPAIDQITVSQELSRMGKLEAVGGVAYLSHIIAVLPTSVNAGHYANVIAVNSYQRRLIDAASRISALGYSGEGGPEIISGKALHLITQLNPPGKHNIVTPQEHADKMLSAMSEMEQQRDAHLSWGIRDLDKILGGMYPGELVLLGARPGVGKSQILLEISHHNARDGKHILFAAVEMSLKQVTEREVSMGIGVDISKIRKGELTQDEWGQVQTIVAEVSELPLYFLCGKCSVANIKQHATMLKQTKGLDLIIVDYLQLLRDKNDKDKGRDLRERIGYISGELKTMAMELDVTVLAASQFSRDLEYRPDHRPRISDLRESGDLEQDADVIILLHRPEMYEPYTIDGILDMGIAKVRQGGQSGMVVKRKWDAKYHQYRDISERKSAPEKAKQGWLYE